MAAAAALTAASQLLPALLGGGGGESTSSANSGASNQSTLSLVSTPTITVAYGSDVVARPQANPGDIGGGLTSTGSAQSVPTASGGGGTTVTPQGVNAQPMSKTNKALIIGGAVAFSVMMGVVLFSD